MKKYTICAAFAVFAVLPLFSQTNTTIDLDDGIYTVLANAELRGLCSVMPGVKPYTEARILRAVDEILLKPEKLTGEEIVFLSDFRARHTRKMENSKN